MTDETPSDDKKAATPTEYVVLRYEPEADSGMWQQVGGADQRYTALNAQAAVKAATDGEGTFVAVPARSWKPLTRKVETVTKDVWA